MVTHLPLLLNKLAPRLQSRNVLEFCADSFAPARLCGEGGHAALTAKTQRRADSRDLGTPRKSL